MPKNPIRRAQLIAPFGVGAMTVIQGGIGLITAGLDHWYRREGDNNNINKDEFRIEEWRLQRLLNVDHFMLPPDYRESLTRGNQLPNTGLTVPFLRFPKWHFCPRCYRLEERPLTQRTRPMCPECNNISMFQVPFVAMCEAGHLQDFPWSEWVHRSSAPTCKGTLRLKATGSASLSGQKVKCDACGMVRDLSSITTANPDGTTFLSNKLLDNGNVFHCRGYRPWLGDEDGEECSCHIRGSLRSASNIYFAHVKSAIYLPRHNHVVSQELINLLENPPLSTNLRLIYALTDHKDSSERWSMIINHLRGYSNTLLLNHYKDNELKKAAEIVLDVQEETLTGNSPDVGEDVETSFRKEEYDVLRQPCEGLLLNIREMQIEAYASLMSNYFSKIMLIDRLRETRALAGFSRVYAENAQTLDERQALLWKKQPSRQDATWLPAYVVFGEGIFLEFDENKLSRWEQHPSVVHRIHQLETRYLAVQQARKLRQQHITPRFVLLHTFAHLIMNRLTFECGYSSAALRERIYASSIPETRMNGILIYTADGDSEGTMGGLVRMGKPGNLEPIVHRALQNALWCSADPVCMEIGGNSGQGPDSCNLAACHNCALVPETACEHFNRFLDRAIVINGFGDSTMGFFDLSET